MMTICEFCGRAHRAVDPDCRFCSVLCREQFDNHPGFYTKSELMTEQLRQGEHLRLYLRLLMKNATLLLEQTETLSPEQQIEKLRAWIADVASKENLMLGVSDLLDTQSES